MAVDREKKIKPRAFTMHPITYEKPERDLPAQPFKPKLPLPLKKDQEVWYLPISTPTKNRRMARVKPIRGIVAEDRPCPQFGSDARLRWELIVTVTPKRLKPYEVKKRILQDWIMVDEPK
jgi:hypothetical protein